MAAISNYYKHDGLKQHKFTVLRPRGQKAHMGSNGLNQGAVRAVFFLNALGENVSPCLFQLSEAAHIPGSWPLPSSLKPTMDSGVFLT